MAAPKIYDPKKCSLVVGSFDITGYPEGSRLTITKADGVTTTTRGMDGDMVINIVNITDGMLTFNLLKSSSDNQKMMWWQKMTKQDAQQYTVMPVSFNDPTGYAIKTLGWIETQADYEASSEIGEMSWTLHLQDATLSPDNTTATLASVDQLLAQRF